MARFSPECCHIPCCEAGNRQKLVSGIPGNSVETLLKSCDLPEVENFRSRLAQLTNFCYQLDSACLMWC